MENDNWNVRLNKLDKPYGDQWELMNDFMAILDIRLYYLYKHHMWVGPENTLQNMMGLAVSRAEFEMNLTKAADSVAGQNLTKEETADIEVITNYFEERFKHTSVLRPELAIIKLLKMFSLNRFARNCLLLAYAVQIEKKYEKIFAYLQDDITKKLPTAEIAIKLFALPGEMIADYFYYFSQNSALAKFLLDLEDNSGPFYCMPINLRERIVDYLIGNNSRFENGYFELFPKSTELHELVVDDFTARCLDSVLLSAANTHQENGESVLVSMTGKNGSGRKFQIKHAVSKNNKNCLFVNLKALLEASGSMESKIRATICEAIINCAYLCFTAFDPLLEESSKNELYGFIASMGSNAAFWPEAIFITSEKDWKDINLPHNFLKVNIPIEPLDESLRLNLWKAFTKGRNLEQDVDLAELATKFRFTPGQIRNAVIQAARLCEVHGLPAIDIVTLHKSCYAQVVVRLDTLANKVQPAYTWNDIVLPADQVTMLQEACSHVKFSHTVYQQWGFEKRISYGKGLSMLFSGPPGTGKTMAAQVVANQLHMEMYKIQLSQVISKYIGETEKNLRQIFEEAKDSNCILFFDETDALFGKRSEVKDSHDRHANIETAYLLQQMEEYDGVIIMATNLLQNIDHAFMRRINFVISFPFPEASTRRLLWEKLLGTDVPIAEDVNLEFMAGQFKIAGGNIKNIVLHAAFLAAAEKTAITMKQLLKSAVNEQKKNNIIIVKEDLKEYADLIF
ncbi:AAA family ATPase [Desulfosporosinus sp. PR]|uniref:ATP-binding protein n=1 Tax=Candidatus Desulfosporosinus nitrosoreducens TaxID=3401928 RepID=UPI0027E8F326|nr:AAA family ATPase [Desulfosporosinus sp. PR]MDQ7096764.1 AAA family ATPase [Desulfosporosinus sp. PR]